MKPRHGLQKKISFIFDRSQSESADTQSKPVSAPQPPDGDDKDCRSADGVIAVDSAASADAVCDGLDADTKAPFRPFPVPRQSSSAGTDRQVAMRLLESAKGVLFGGKTRQLDKRQKKMAILVSVLAVVFVAVFAIVLSPGASKAHAVPAAVAARATIAPGGPVYNWKQPQAYPVSLRDPMKHSSQARGGAESPGDLVVRGIVYSSKNPTAIIAGQIVGQGQTIAGAKVVRINRDSVEFEKDGKSWVQQVEQ